MLIANKSDEAFRLAQTHSQMEVYTSIIGEHISSDDALKVAHYYEKAQDYGRAGRFYSMCGQYPRALKLFFQCGDREIDAAIEVTTHIFRSICCLKYMYIFLVHYLVHIRW